MVQSMPRLAYEESFTETGDSLAKNNLPQLHPMPSLTLTSLELESCLESLYSTLCFLLSMLLAFSVERDRFQLWSFQLTRVQLCSSQSLQEKELARSASTLETSFAAGAFDTAGFAAAAAAAPAATASASCITSSSSPSRPRASAAPPSTTTTTTTNFSRKRVDELEETNNFAAMGQELAKYIANLREISQNILPKNFRELEVIKDNFPQKLTSMLVK